MSSIVSKKEYVLINLLFLLLNGVNAVFTE